MAYYYRIKKGLLPVSLAFLVSLGGCAAPQADDSLSEGAEITASHSGPIEIGLHKITQAQQVPITVLDQFPQAPDGNITRIDLGNSDVRNLDLNAHRDQLVYARFNTNTVWPEKLPDSFDPQKIIEFGKDPGLHIRSLHDAGIDGSGISIGIVDLTLYTGHSEYKENLVYYEDIPKSEAQWHMHGAGVASLAVGKTTGVAPGAKLYFIEASWEDAQGAEGETTYRYYAQGIHRLLDINKQLPQHERIRVISISAYPSADHGVNDYNDYVDALERAKKEGVFIIAVSLEEDYGFRFGGLEREPMGDPNRLASYEATYLEDWMDEGRIFIPMGSRSFASYLGEDTYAWARPGGASWAVPYMAGLYALSAQVNENITPELFWEMVEATADPIMDKGYGRNIQVCNPVQLILAISTETLSIPLPEATANEPLPEAEKADPQTTVLQAFDNLMLLFDWAGVDGFCSYSFQEWQYKKEDMPTYGFDSSTQFVGNEVYASEILESGKNPGLGIRDLHQQGITGNGVRVAIIDQHMLLEHPEYAEQIVAYYDSGCDQPEGVGSYTSSPVTGMLAGKTTGVAPQVSVYYAAAPSWHMDSSYFADCLYWIIEQNKPLPADEKIRLVSVSAAPQDGWYSNGQMWTDAVSAAEKEGILVIDCRISEPTGFVSSAYGDWLNPDNIETVRPGTPDIEWNDDYAAYFQNTILAPSAYRTLPLELYAGSYNYRYVGTGGTGLAVPYAAGVLALGWQVRPDLSADTMKTLLIESCWISDSGMRFINPPAFIDSVRQFPMPTEDPHAL